MNRARLPETNRVGSIGGLSLAGALYSSARPKAGFTGIGYLTRIEQSFYSIDKPRHIEVDEKAGRATSQAHVGENLSLMNRKQSID